LVLVREPRFMDQARLKALSMAQALMRKAGAEAQSLAALLGWAALA
jgi:hypothetical protein